MFSKDFDFWNIKYYTEAAAAAICPARSGASRDSIREYITRQFGYDLSRTCDEIRAAYQSLVISMT